MPYKDHEKHLAYWRAYRKQELMLDPVGTRANAAERQRRLRARRRMEATKAVNLNGPLD